jgi:hypothetical protein
LAYRFGGGYWLLLTLKKVIRFELSAPEKQPGANRDFMKRTSRNNDMRAEYDFAGMKSGVRGKYARRYREGTNIVLLDPDIAKAFPNDKAVNQALRGVLTTARAVRRTGGLADKSPSSAGNRPVKRSKLA